MEDRAQWRAPPWTGPPTGIGEGRGGRRSRCRAVGPTLRRLPPPAATHGHGVRTPRGRLPARRLPEREGMTNGLPAPRWPDRAPLLLAGAGLAAGLLWAYWPTLAA